MRHLASMSALAFALAFPLVACDNAVDVDVAAETAPVVRAQPIAAEVAVEPNLMAECHAAYRAASEALEANLASAATCQVDSDCTVTVAETRCTGELDLAVSKVGEAGFLAFVDKLDVKTCSAVPSSCLAPGAADPAAPAVACVANRCTLVDE